MRNYYYKYELLDNDGAWQDYTNQVINRTFVSLGNIFEVGSPEFGIDKLKKFMDFEIGNNSPKKQTASPLLYTNQFQIGRRVRLKVRTANSTGAVDVTLTGKNQDYLFVENLIDVVGAKILGVDDSGGTYTADEVGLKINNFQQFNWGTMIYFNRIINDWENIHLMLTYTASDLDTDRVEVEGTGATSYFIPNIKPDVMKILGHYEYSWLPGHYYMTDLYFSSTYGVSYRWVPREGNLDYPFEIINAVYHDDGVTITLNTPLPLQYRLVIGLFYNEAEDHILFDGVITSFSGAQYDGVQYSAQDFSWYLETMALSKIYPKEVTVEDTIKEILKDNGKDGLFEFLYDSHSTMTLTADYKVEDITVWEAIQKLAIVKGWTLYFNYNREKQAQVLLFEDPQTRHYVTYQVLRKDLVGEITYKGDLLRVRNIVDVIYKDSEDGNKIKTYTVEDEDSKTRYRPNRLTLGTDITEGAITTYAAAKSMGDQALADLKDPIVMYTLGSTLLPKFKLNDELWYQHENIQEKALTMRAYSIEHTIEVDKNGKMKGTTQLLGSGKVQYKLNSWLKIDAKVKDNWEIIIN